jgi:hypothetical protein
MTFLGWWAVIPTAGVPLAIRAMRLRMRVRPSFGSLGDAVGSFRSTEIAHFGFGKSDAQLHTAPVKPLGYRLHRANVLTPQWTVLILKGGESVDWCQPQTMLGRVKSALVFLALLIGAALVFGTAEQALAHAGHDHGSAAPQGVVKPSAPVVDVVLSAATKETEPGPGEHDAKLNKQSVPKQPVHQGNCCCGSFACHAGVAALVSISHPYAVGERLALPPVLEPVPSRPGGIERPPRTDMPR